MPFLVQSGETVLVSWSDFIREPFSVEDRFIIPGIPEFQARKVRPTDEHRPFKNFLIHRGRYYVDPGRNQKKVLRQGLPVVATLDGDLVGEIDTFNLWVRPDCTKQGLSVELLVDRFRYTAAGAGWHKPQKEVMRYTKAGFGTMKAAYRALVERGFIDPGPSGLPAL